MNSATAAPSPRRRCEGCAQLFKPADRAPRGARTAGQRWPPDANDRQTAAYLALAPYALLGIVWIRFIHTLARWHRDLPNLRRGRP